MNPTIRTTNSSRLLKEPYPLNLLRTIEYDAPVETVIPYKETQEVLDGIQCAVTMLAERDQRLIHLRFVERNTFEAVGKEFGFTAECARHHIHLVLRRLRKPELKQYYFFDKKK